VALECRDGTIVARHDLPHDSQLPWISPGWIDLQVNGFGGRGFNRPGLTASDVQFVTHALRQQGVTRYLATCTTDSREQLLHSCTQLGMVCAAQQAAGRGVAGIHLEGPYISPHDGPRGAHPREQVRPPDWSEFEQLQTAAGGAIRLVTLSPEYDTAPEFIARAVAAGVVVSLGHTAATGAQIAAAVAAGATLSTHLGNGCALQLPRHPNCLWEQLAEDGLSASFIADGHHLPESVLKVIVRAKTLQRCLLVSDYSELAGTPPGCYRNALGEVEVLPDGRIVVAGQRALLAGAASSLATGVWHIRQAAGLTLAEAISLVTEQPARAMGWPVRQLRPGEPDDVVCFTETPHALVPGGVAPSH
jgi:N-acetylglucosamine-6-phosphate deacetylase